MHYFYDNQGSIVAAFSELDANNSESDLLTDLSSIQANELPFKLLDNIKVLNGKLSTTDAATLESVTQYVSTKLDSLIDEAAFLLETPSVLAGLSPDQQTAMIAYHSALREIPKQAGFPLNVLWPEKPEV